MKTEKLTRQELSAYLPWAIYKLIGETEPHLLWDLEWIFKWIKAGHAEALRKWIIDTENKTL